ncbi:DNA-binding protein HU-beta [Dysgonomonas sp. PH5-45]|uniref:HU family DNA-binding protein n=1 Tax=unclassified Dysgonomonas TaxID=2630389 RepID=UPI0024744908|nr:MULTISPECIES: HU family DNA-binding protein [unclassified Dysgonomonas]MDH6354920.1 DNA-binding protein HU-beta [Dysgonomonas sp. PH5-45]MDH6387819.1 DNA-binding protein HU-beta [Dysgonomonas sp. PH5-37]
MTNKELIETLAKRLDWTQNQTADVLKNAVDVLSNSLSESDTVSIQGFGVFETKKLQERISVNPVSKQRFLVPPKIAPAFRPSQIIKDKLKNTTANE